MTKHEFLAKLRQGLSGLPQEDMEERLIFYSEMIDDRMEEGLSEEEAVAAAGDVDRIIAQAVADTPISKLAKEKIRGKVSLKPWHILLLVLGFPVWFPLCVAAISVAFSLCVAFWSVLIALWAVVFSVAVCGIAFLAMGIYSCCVGNIGGGIAVIGGGLLSLGLFIFLLYGCKAVTKGLTLLTKMPILWIKNRIFGKGEAA